MNIFLWETNMIKTLKFISIFLFILIFVCIFSTFSDEQKKPDYSEAIRLINTWLEAQRDYDKLPGISAAIVMDQ